MIQSSHRSSFTCQASDTSVVLHDSPSQLRCQGRRSPALPEGVQQELEAPPSAEVLDSLFLVGQSGSGCVCKESQEGVRGRA